MAPNKALSQKEKDEIKALSRLFARKELGEYKGADFNKSMEEITGKPKFATQDYDPSRPHSLVRNIEDMSSIIEQGANGDSVVDFRKEDSDPNRLDYLKKLAENRKDWSGLVPLGTVDRLLKEAPNRENPSDYLSYISDTFGIGPADSRAKGAKEAKINDFFTQKLAERDATTPPGGPSGPVSGPPPTANASSAMGLLGAPSQGPVGKPSEELKAEEEKKPGIFSRIFDKLDRVAKALPTGLERANEAEARGEGGFMQFGNLDDLAKGTLDTLKGKDPEKRVGFSRVIDPGHLKKADGTALTGAADPLFRNKAVRAVSGFALDVAADPTTYVSFGAGGAIKKGFQQTTGIAGREAAVKTAGARAFKEVADSPNSVTSSILNQVRDEDILKAMNKGSEAASKTILKEGTQEAADKSALEAAQLQLPFLRNKSGVTAKAVGVKLTEKAEKVGQRSQQFAAIEAKKIAEEKALASTQKAIQIKFAGKAVPGLSSTTAYNALMTVGKKAGETSAGQLLNRSFRTASFLPGKTRALANATRNLGYSNWEQADSLIRQDLLPDLTRAEAIQVTHAIEQGTPLAGVMSEAGTDLGEAVEKAKAFNADMWEAEKSIGLHGDTAPIDNYVHHTYLSGKPEQQKKFKALRKAISTETPGFEKQRLVATLQDSKQAGLKPVEDIREILSLRARKSHMVRARADFVNRTAKEYGVSLPKAQAKKIGMIAHESKFLSKDIYFPEPIANALKGVEKMYTDDVVFNNLTRTTDKALNTWKALTLMTPGYHSRGISGDIFQNFLDGVDNPISYAQAVKVMKKEGKIKVGNKAFGADEIWNEYVSSGAKASFGAVEIVGQTTGNFLPNSVLNPTRKFSDTRENFVRIANFVDTLKKQGTKVNDINDLKAIAPDAAAKVDKALFNYSDLTEFEKTKMRRISPFYTYFRKNLPLQLEALYMKPGRLATKGKAFNAIEEILGTREGENFAGSEPEGLPQWMKDDFGSGETLRTSEDSIFSPRLPTEDLNELQQTLQGESNRNWGDQLGSRAHPLFQYLAQTATHRDFLSGNNLGDDTSKVDERTVPTNIKFLLAQINPNASKEEKAEAIRKLLYSTYDASRREKIDEDKKSEEDKKKGNSTGKGFLNSSL